MAEGSFWESQYWGLTSEVGLVPLLEDILSDLVVGTLVEVAVKATQRVLLDDAAHKLAWLAWQRGNAESDSSPATSPMYPPR